MGGGILNNDCNSITRHCAIQYGCTKDTKLLQLQYKLLHRILPTNKWLKKIGIVLDDTCAFCNTETENMFFLNVHLLLVSGVKF